MSGRSGRYRHRLELQDYTEARSPSKQMVKTWATIARMWGEIEVAYKGEEMLGAVRHSTTPQVASVGRYRIKIRYRKDVTFSPRQRVKYGNRIFQITEVQDVTGLKTEISLMCLEIQI